MSGHSKWSTIKRKKGLIDAKKGQAWTKVANMIMLAARQGADPEMNFRLRIAIDKAKEANMPKDNIERAIKKGSGADKGANFEEIRYEGYGPGGVAIIVDAATDNRNRTAGEVRAAFTKHSGKLGETGSVGWMFEQKGQILVYPEKRDKDELMLEIIDLGAQDVEETENGELIIYTDPKDLEEVQKKIAQMGLKMDAPEISYIPKNQVDVNDEKTAGQILKIIDILEGIDDVTDVVSNYNIPDELMEKLG